MRSQGDQKDDIMAGLESGHGMDLLPWELGGIGVGEAKMNAPPLLLLPCGEMGMNRPGLPLTL